MDNPYQSPAQDVLSVSPPRVPLRGVSVLLRFGLWTAVCAVSAIPSSIWAYNVIDHAFKMHAIALGIMLFAAIYTLLGLIVLEDALVNHPLLKRAAFIGFGIRLTISAIFPLGMVADVLPGLLSLALVRSIWFVPQDPELMQAPVIVLTTLVQGLVLNIILWCCILVLCGLLYVIHRGRFSDERQPNLSYQESKSQATR